jgi:acyl-coenzyme A thioesterase PaaI-like protein
VTSPRDRIMRTLDTLPEMSLEIGSDELTGHVRFTARFEGSGGAAHGGFVAAVFDHILGIVANGDARRRTASITVDYRSLTPIDTLLRLQAGVERVDGRKLWAAASLFDADRLCAEARGLFVELAESPSMSDGRQGGEASPNGERRLGGNPVGGT